jgi:hypothetical protein
MGWGALFGEPYSEAGAPRPEPTALTFLTRGGPEPCETTDSSHILEVRNSTNELVYRAEKVDPTEVTTAPGKWLDYLVSAPFDPTCQAGTNNGWALTTCVPTGPGTYRATFTSHGVSYVLPALTIRADHS